MAEQAARSGISEYYTTCSAICAGMKSTSASRPNTTPPGITVAMPIRIGMPMPIIAEFNRAPVATLPKGCEGS